MPNPYKYTKEEVDDLVEQWHNDKYMYYSLEDFVKYVTKFSDYEYERWVQTGEIPNA